MVVSLKEGCPTVLHSYNITYFDIFCILTCNNGFWELQDENLEFLFIAVSFLATSWVLAPALVLNFNEFTSWVFPKMGVPQNGWLIMENPIEMDDLGVSLFSETPYYIFLSFTNQLIIGYWNARCMVSIFTLNLRSLIISCILCSVDKHFRIIAVLLDCHTHSCFSPNSLLLGFSMLS